MLPIASDRVDDELMAAFDALASTRTPLTGNTAKVRVLCELLARMRRQRTIRVLDVGCAGPRPLEFWAPLLELDGEFALTGVDVAGIERARQVAEGSGWRNVHLVHGSGYRLQRLFSPRSFDIVVATQVLEHIARPRAFLRQIAAVLRHHGEVFLTVDSAHWRPRFPLRSPIRLAKDGVKKALALLRYERHYDLPWTDGEIREFGESAGFRLSTLGYYNIGALKFMHNHHLPDVEKNPFMRKWFTLEQSLNHRMQIDEMAKRLFAAVYVQLQLI